MAWTYLAASEGSLELWTAMSHQLPIVSVTSTPEPFYAAAWELVTYHLPLYGTTCEPSADTDSPQSTSSMEASHVRTLAGAVLEWAWTESEAVYLAKFAALPKKLKRNGSFSKMSQTSELKDWEESSRDWPISAMTVGGVLYPLPVLDRRLRPASDGSCWLRPQARDYKGYSTRNITLPNQLRHLGFSGKPNPPWLEWLMGYPTGWSAR
jgi:hypothetical protein